MYNNLHLQTIKNYGKFSTSTYRCMFFLLGECPLSCGSMYICIISKCIQTTLKPPVPIFLRMVYRWLLINNVLSLTMRKMTVIH